MQRHPVDVDVLAQHVARGTGDIGDNGRFTACQRIQQAGFPGIRASGNHYLHPFAQQAALARFGAHGVKIGDDAIELRFDFAVREKVDLLIRKINSRFDVDSQVSKCFHKVVNAGGKCPL
ncbi:Uncharacterised protein [Salmonella enterica subsp. enterica serovar Typhi]|nr:Uncharacterised protein [Salmonella enterica subsp. enterica serovar Typhi]CXA60356.1 Uncharacterised protein [Salmonella enterica subsp. enterica serovar Typhi]CXB49422.1 Uncharacterised protein [Salmonella enterica subsp. enterica serovar Typhi]